MSIPVSETCPSLKQRFAWHEKLVARACLGVVLCAGALAMYRENPAVSLGYLLFVGLGGLLVVYDFLCVYCPYPFEHSDCLFYPYPLVARFARLRGGEISGLRRIGTAVVFAGMFAAPQYWLSGRWDLFSAFWAATLLLAVLVPVYLCRRCLHRRCPMNRAGAR